MPMSSDKLTFGRRVGGVTVYKPGVNTAATESTPTVDTVNLNADEWAALVLYPKSMGMDMAASIGEMIAMEMAQAFAQAADDCGFIGDGTPTYLDVMGLTPRLIAVNGVDDGGGLVLGSGNAWSELTEEDFLRVKAAVPRYAQRNFKWYASNAFYWRVMAKIQLAKGGVTAAEFANAGSLLFLGDPVEITQSLPSTEANSQVPVLGGDLRMAATHGVREDLKIEEDRSVNFKERQVAVLATQRQDISIHSIGDASNAGPVVGLITAAA
jgi:HK97 family phage major capsid protein